MDDDDEEGRGQHQVFCLQRFPEDVFGDDDQKMYPITELDPAKVRLYLCGSVFCTCVASFFRQDRHPATNVKIRYGGAKFRTP